ncbi:hypothetical protein PENSUB_14161 [Penicillium subrubescens]|uniref:Uncharacterized protein n=1 Tax=Penicillium subrubescens TaxID=1316194 RepID=A0A1Q5UPH9_9EURO|nr:hypothetical protein PENSUB_14161 [Penicillium subrubescens]
MEGRQLTGIQVVVFIYASFVLAFNTWMTRRYANAESRQKDPEAELYPMLSKDDVPFGAKALERGVQVEGIWVSKNNTPHSSTVHPETPITDQPLSPDLRKSPVAPPFPASLMAMESAKRENPLRADTPNTLSTEASLVTADKYEEKLHTPAEVYTPPMSSEAPSLPSTFNRHSEGFVGDKKNQKRASFHSRIWHAGHIFDTKPVASNRDRDELGLAQAGNVPVAHSLDERRRASRISRVLRKRSSEEFRRKMSAIFNERIHMNEPSERLEIDPMFQNTQSRNKRKSILT